MEHAAGFAPVWVREQDGLAAVAATTEGLREQFALGPIYPNSFNARAIVPISVPAGGGAVVLDVFNALGQRVGDCNAEY